MNIFSPMCNPAMVFAHISFLSSMCTQPGMKATCWGCASLFKIFANTSGPFPHQNFKQPIKQNVNKNSNDRFNI